MRSRLVKFFVAALLLSSMVYAEQLPFSQNGYWPTGILDPHCPNRYELTGEPGHFFLMCWGQR
jgi:hypothetical protein